ncbi:MAG: hypothetical protein KDA05_11030, partial [Phycisphaerales bacterium]|nr:hypothetical protein [Phycisphaerales bacterium]
SAGWVRSTARMYAGAIEAGFDQVAFERGVASLRSQGDERRAEMLVLGNTALQTAMAWHALGPDPVARLNALADRPPEWWEEIIRRTVTPANRRITILAPRAPAGAGE